MRSIPAFLVWASLVLCSAAKQEDSGAAEFEKLLRSFEPRDHEAWGSIPWQISLVEAREIAILEEKPIFVWCLDGHPLGNC
jgi:hypothetical protein